LSSFYGLLAVVPALAMPVLLGGVTGAEFWRTVLALMDALFLSLTTGMFVSAISRDEQRAWLGTLTLVSLPVIVLPIVRGVTGLDIFGWFSISTGLTHAFEDAYKTNPLLYWRPLWLTNLLGWLWLGAASFLLPKVWRETGRDPRPRTRAAARDPRRRARQLSINPVWWLASRHQDQQRWMWIVVLVTVGTAVVVLAREGANGSTWWLLLCAMVTLHLLLSVWVAVEACYSFADARSSGAMELLLSTPLTVRQIIRGQQLALKDLFLNPVITLVVAEVLILCVCLAMLSASQANAFEAFWSILILTFCIAWFLLDLVAVSRVGMWFSLTSAKPTHALTKTILVSLVLPMVVLPCCHIVGPGLMVAKSVILITWAQSRLENDFRAVAARRFETSRPRAWMAAAPPTLRMPEG